MLPIFRVLCFWGKYWVVHFSLSPTKRMVSARELTKISAWKAEAPRKTSIRAFARKHRIPRSTLRYYATLGKVPESNQSHRKNEAKRAIRAFSIDVSSVEIAKKLGLNERTVRRLRAELLSTQNIAKTRRKMVRKRVIAREKKIDAAPLPARFSSYRNIWS